MKHANRMTRESLSAYRLERSSARPTLTLSRGPEWMFDERRGCNPAKLDDPDLFVSDERADQRKAKKLCRSCPFQAACDAWATQNDERYFVWGGKVRSADLRRQAAHRKRRVQRAADSKAAKNPHLGADLERHGDRMRELMARYLTNAQISVVLDLDRDRVAALRWFIDNNAAVPA